MLKDEVISIFNEHLTPYTKWNFENLILLAANQHRSEVQGKSGKRYLFELTTELDNNEEKERTVSLYMQLTELEKKFYKPQSHIVYEIGKSGTIYRDGLNLHSHH